MSNLNFGGNPDPESVIRIRSPDLYHILLVGRMRSRTALALSAAEPLQEYFQRSSIIGLSLLAPRSTTWLLSIVTTGQTNDITSVSTAVSKAVVLVA